MTHYDPLTALQEEDKPKADRDRKGYVSKVLEGLQGDAYQVAEDLGREELASPGGIPKLVEAIRNMIQSKKDQEAKELYLEGAKKNGLLARQRGEPMTNSGSSFSVDCHRFNCGCC